jgi:heme/copper-type cytochrome/quinol oxidase subunit 3
MASSPASFAIDLAPLPTHAFGHRSLTWWGIVAFFLIEGTGFILAIAAYFFLFNQNPLWPPRPLAPPDLIPGVLFTAILLLSEIPNAIAKHAAEAGDLRRLRKVLILMSGIGLVLMIVRGFEFAGLNVLWYENAYASAIWLLLFLHTLHIATDWVDTLVLTALMHTDHGEEGRRFVDCAENALYWRFVWLSWLPMFVLIYWVPRLVS